MANLSEILSLLEAERDRYVLEAADLERRLSFVHNQVTTLETLISGYVLEEQMNQPVRHLPDPSVAVLEDNPEEVDELDEGTLELELEEESPLTSISNESPVASSLEPDISDIPKLTTPRKPGTLPPLPEFQEYSIQNAILILMRRRPDLHFHIDAIVRDLYGENLTLEQFKTAKMNAGKALSTGVQLGLWYRILRANGVYTLRYEKGVTSKLYKSK